MSLMGIRKDRQQKERDNVTSQHFNDNFIFIIIFLTNF